MLHKFLIPNGTKGRVFVFGSRGLEDFRKYFEIGKNRVRGFDQFPYKRNPEDKDWPGIKVEREFLLVDPKLAEMYKRADRHPLIDKLGPSSEEMISIAMKNGRHKRSTFIFPNKDVTRFALFITDSRNIKFVV